MMKMREYPFCPKSTSYLEPGQYWPIALSNGYFAAGRVLQINMTSGARDRRMFLAGLMNWCSDAPPNVKSLAGARLLDFGVVHTRMFSSNGFQIEGHRPLGADHLSVPLTLDCAPSRHARVVRGFDILGFAKPAQYSLPILTTWGMGVIVLLAEGHFVGK